LTIEELDKEVHLKVCQLYAEGYSVNSIARKIKISHTAVGSVLEKYKIKKRTQSEALKVYHTKIKKV
jgi:DNA-binding NarL/FixJ family response regulator